jgi:hypothetical protein
VSAARYLGKLAPRLDPRTLRLAPYLVGIPAAPPRRDWFGVLPAELDMYQNDRIGDCAIASAATLLQVWTGQNAALVRLTDDDVIAAYSAVGGYVAGEPETDRGCDMLSVLNYWRKFGIGGHRIAAFVKLDHDNPYQIQAAINLFGGVYVGASLPKSAMASGGLWMAPDHNGPDSDRDRVGGWGGHAMACASFDRRTATFGTWGDRQRATWGWWLKYVDECYAVLSPEWIDNLTRLAPSGFDLAQLLADLEALA